MSARCSICDMPVFDEDGQCYGEELPDGTWLCDECSVHEPIDKFPPQAGSTRWLSFRIRGISTWIRKCVDEGLVRIPNRHTISAVGELAIMSEEIRLGGGGRVFKELFLEIGPVEINLAELLQPFNYKKVRITVEVVE